MEYEFNKELFEKHSKLIEDILNGLNIEVEFGKNVFSDAFIEPGMRATIQNVKIDESFEGDVLCDFTFDLSKFEEFNKQFETNDWIVNGNENLTARETNNYPENNLELHCYSISNAELPFKVLDSVSKKIYELYKHSNSELSYNQWMEHEINKVLSVGEPE